MQLDLNPRNVQTQMPTERASGWGQLDVIESEGTETLSGIGGEHRVPQVTGDHGVQERRGDVLHLGGSGRRRNDLGPNHQLVAKAVIAVGMGVDHGADGRCRDNPGHLGEHGGGQPDIKQRVDQQRTAIPHHQTSVGPSPTAIGLQIAKQAVGEFVQAVVERRTQRAHDQRGSQMTSGMSRSVPAW